jgi:hypothetical protein
MANVGLAAMGAPLNCQDIMNAITDIQHWQPD